MAEVKVNVGSPFHKKYQEDGMTKVVLDIYVYSGRKSLDRGKVKYSMEKEPIGSDDYVVFDLTDLIKDFIEPTLELPLDDNKGYIKWVELQAKIISDKPVANSFTVSTDENTPLTIELNGDDPEFRDLSFIKVTDPSSGVLGPITNKKRIVYTPNTDFNGSDSFTFKVNNGIEDSDDATVNIIVRDVISAIEYDFTISGSNTRPYSSVPQAIYNHFYGSGDIGTYSYSLNFKGAYADDNDELTFRIGMVGTSPTSNNPVQPQLLDGYYAAFSIVALISPDYWQGLSFPSGNTYTIDDLPQSFQDVIEQNFIFNGSGDFIYGYLLVVRVQGGVVTERYEFKESDYGSWNTEVPTYDEWLTSVGL
jgi:hypothetical protein